MDEELNDIRKEIIKERALVGHGDRTKLNELEAKETDKLTEELFRGRQQIKGTTHFQELAKWWSGGRKGGVKNMPTSGKAGRAAVEGFNMFGEGYLGFAGTAEEAAERDGAKFGLASARNVSSETWNHG